MHCPKRYCLQDQYNKLKEQITLKPARSRTLVNKHGCKCYSVGGYTTIAFLLSKLKQISLITNRWISTKFVPLVRNLFYYSPCFVDQRFGCLSSPLWGQCFCSVVASLWVHHWIWTTQWMKRQTTLTTQKGLWCSVVSCKWNTKFLCVIFEDGVTLYVFNEFVSSYST